MSKTNEEIKKETTLDEELEKLDNELNPENALAEKPKADKEEDLQFIEVQIGPELVEDDIERFDWEWK